MIFWSCFDVSTESIYRLCPVYIWDPVHRSGRGNTLNHHQYQPLRVQITPCPIIHSITTQPILNSVDGSAHIILVLIAICTHNIQTYTSILKWLPGDLYVCMCVCACMLAGKHICMYHYHVCIYVKHLEWLYLGRASVRRTYDVYYVQKSAAYAEITHQRRTADFWKFLITAENGYRDVLSAEKNPPTVTRLRDLCPAFVLETHLFCLLTTPGRPTWLISRVLLTASVTCSRLQSEG